MKNVKKEKDKQIDDLTMLMINIEMNQSHSQRYNLESH